MSDTLLQGEIDTESETVKRLVDSLPTQFPKSESSTNYKIYGSVGVGIEELKEDISQADKATKITEAETIEELQELANLVGVYPQSDDTLERFRIRTLASFQNITSEGTIDDILTSASYVLDIPVEQIKYDETEGPGTILLSIQESVVEDSELTGDEIAELLQQNLAAGYQLSTIARGSLRHISEERYDTNDYDSDRGYATLDEDGNVTEGGTYSTVLE